MSVELFGLSLELKYALAPVVGALIGYVTNYLAIKMLFHPRRPVRLGFLTLQGIFPKRKQALAENLGRMIETELFNHDDIQRIVHDPSFVGPFKEVADRRIATFLETKLAGVHPMARMLLSKDLLAKIKTRLLAEIDEMLPEILETASTELENRLVVREVVQKKVEEFSLEKVEEILFAILKKEFRFIEVVGGVLGFVIGLAQAVLFAYA